MNPTYDEIVKANALRGNVIRKTPLIHSPTFSNLTNSEIKLSSLIRMNMDTKSIATILHQTYDSVRVSRTRLRKKLKLSKDDTLISYLMQF